MQVKVLTYKKHTFYDDNHTLGSHFYKSAPNITYNVIPCCNTIMLLRLCTTFKIKIEFHV